MTDVSLSQFGATAFTMILIVVDPVAIAPIFLAVTAGMDRREKRAVLARATATAFGIATFFLFIGPTLLASLGVSLHAFGIAGGILLFMLSLPMLFGEKKSPHPRTLEELGKDHEDVAIFPLGIPQLVGPGTIATILVLHSQAGDDPRRMTIILTAIIAVYAVCWVVLLTAEAIMAKLGNGVIQVLTKVLGILLAALAVQYILNGIGEFRKTLT